MTTLSRWQQMRQRLDATKPQRKFWQINLSTAIALTLAAGFMVGVNAKPDIVFSPEKGPKAAYRAYGWPVHFSMQRDSTLDHVSVPSLQYEQDFGPFELASLCGRLAHDRLRSLLQEIYLAR
jgi:hypothetical protein